MMEQMENAAFPPFDFGSRPHTLDDRSAVFLRSDQHQCWTIPFRQQLWSFNFALILSTLWSFNFPVQGS